MTKMPVLFLSHGSPMQAVTTDGAPQAWAEHARGVPRPSAILMVSAHWETDIPLVTANAKPPLIYDFGGFPEALYRIQYAAPGAPQMAAEFVDLLGKAGIAAATDTTRGLDHGAWVPLLHMYPDADIPVVQLAIQPQLDAQHHLQLGQALIPLRDEGVLIIGSGHMTHNLRDFFRRQSASGNDAYAENFAQWVGERITQRRIEELTQWRQDAPEAVRAHPTPEHFLPLFVALGAAGERYSALRFFDGFEGGVLAMDAYSFT